MLFRSVSPGSAMARLGALILLPLIFDSVFSISFFLPVRTRKCLKEEIHKDVLVTGEYEISEQPNTKSNLKVRVWIIGDANANAKANATSAVAKPAVG